MPDAIRNHLAALRLVQLSCLIEEVIHIHAPQLSDPFLLRHPPVEVVNLLLHVLGTAASQ